MIGRPLSKESKYLEIPKFRLILGILMGLFYSLVFYSLQYLTREVLRMFSVTEDFDLWILTDKEVSFYNLIFAFISVIIAQSICFSFWFDRPRKIFKKRHYKITSIVNDQRFLNWYFLSWFSKLAVFYGILFGLAFGGGFYVFSFYPHYKYIFFLILIVLFLQTWNTIRLTIKRKSLKWMLFSGIIISIVAIGLSRINLIDYKAINQSYLEGNMHHNYILELPETDSMEILYRLSLIEDIYVVKSRNQNETEPLIIVENKETDLKKLKERVVEWQSMQIENEKPYITYKLHIDKTIKMGFVNQLKDVLAKTGATRIAYAVVPKNPEYDIRYYKNFSFQARTLSRQSDGFNPEEIYEDVNGFQNIIEINQTTSGECFINDEPIENHKIKQTIRHLIITNSDYIIKFHVNDNVEFSDYFKVISYSKEVINDLRNKYSTEIYSKEFERVDSEQRKEVNRKFPLRIFEITTDIKESVNQK